MITFYKRKASRTNLIQVDGFQVSILRSNRKRSASIKVKEGSVSITVPQQAATADIESLIIKKSSWIKKQLLRQSEADQLLKRTYSKGDKLFYRGQQVTLSFQDNQNENIIIKGDQLLVLSKLESSSENTREIIKNQFKREAEQYLVEKTELYAKIIGATYSGIKVKSYKSRWGSCSSQGLISYNWRIIIAPEPVIDYIIVHELCHLIEHNHSPRFWALVERFSPDYKQHRSWLRENGLLLVI
jgi:predicted metal-dependent hydrolase